MYVHTQLEHLGLLVVVYREILSCYNTLTHTLYTLSLHYKQSSSQDGSIAVKRLNYRNFVISIDVGLYGCVVVCGVV